MKLCVEDKTIESTFASMIMEWEYYRMHWERDICAVLILKLKFWEYMLILWEKLWQEVSEYHLLWWVMLLVLTGIWTVKENRLGKEKYDFHKYYCHYWKKKTKENMRIILWKICMSGKISHSYYCVSQSKLRMGNPITSIRLSERDGLQVCAKICHLKRRDL